MADDIEFVDGLLIKPPHQKAPDFVKASIAIKVEDLGKWLREKYKAGNEWVNCDIKISKSGRWYASVSNFKKDDRKATSKTAAPKPTLDDDDIPFAPIGKVEASTL